MKEDPTLPADARFETRAIHVGQDYRSETGAVIPPIYMTSTFETGNPTGFDYTRSPAIRTSATCNARSPAWRTRSTAPSSPAASAPSAPSCFRSKRAM
jgi:cystathionine beta-lyase/cystathionine gamma-synthase